VVFVLAMQNAVVTELSMHGVYYMSVPVLVQYSNAWPVPRSAFGHDKLGRHVGVGWGRAPWQCADRLDVWKQQLLLAD
jgi:hypothetical protein